MHVPARARCITLCCLFTTLAPASAFADWMVTPFIGLKFAGDTTIIQLEPGAAKESKLTLGGSLAIVSDEIFGIEAELGYSPRFFERAGTGGLVARSNVTTLTGNVIAALPKRITRESLRPYAVAGVGMIHVGIADLKGSLVDTNLLGIDVGGGAIGPLTRRTSLRFDIRHVRNLRRGQAAPGFGETEISFWRATVGVALLGSLF